MKLKRIYFDIRMIPIGIIFYYNILSFLDSYLDFLCFLWENSKYGKLLVSRKEVDMFFQYFKEICAIPHGSGNCKQISDYCVSFAKEHGLTYVQDGMYNVIIKKSATEGYENRPTIMLQGHLDMVEEKDSDSTWDFSNGVELREEGDWLCANGTTLGGDDGIAVAFMLSILADNDLKHPALECVFTVDEETGLFGAAGIDLSDCKAQYLINMDSEDEGVFLASCAGGVRANLELPVQRVELDGTMYEVTIDHLLGGHSGIEIHKERGNANIMMGRLLFALTNRTELSWGLVCLDGGLKDNAIPRTCKAVIVSDDAEEDVKACLTEIFAEIRKEYTIAEPEMELFITKCEEEAEDVLHPSSMMKTLFFLTQCKNGVQNMSQAVAGLVETSLNLGVLHTTEDAVKFRFSLRSAVESRKQDMLDKLAFLIEFLGGDIDTSGDYPGWEYKVDSPLRDQMTTIWTNMYQTAPKIDLIHAGVECGLILQKMPNLDIVSIGPNMKDIHTPKERLSISSCKRVYDFVIKLLEELQ